MFRFIPRPGEKIVSISQVRSEDQFHVVTIIRRGLFRKKYGSVLASSKFDDLLIAPPRESSAADALARAHVSVEIRDSIALYYGRGANPPRRRAVRPPSARGRTAAE